MNLKTSAIALAVAGAVAAPMAVQAESGFYASVRVGATFTDSKASGPIPAAGTDTSNLEIGSRSSRFGFKGETDLGNGLTAFGRYELSIGDGGVSTRHLYVGLMGDWGTVKLGKTYVAMYNFIEGPVDWCNISCGTGVLGNNSRTENAAEYSGGTGIFSYGIAYTADGSTTAGSDVGQGYQAAGNLEFAGGAVNLALGIQGGDVEDVVNGGGGDIAGLTVKGTAGNFYYAVMVEQNDMTDGIVLALDWSGFYLQYGVEDNDAAGAADPSYYTVGYNQSLGRQTSAYYEYSDRDADTGDSNDDSSFLHATLKYAWK